MSSLRILPGVVQAGGFMSISGGRDTEKNYNIDGMDNVDVAQGKALTGGGYSLSDGQVPHEFRPGSHSGAFRRRRAVTAPRRDGVPPASSTSSPSPVPTSITAASIWISATTSWISTIPPPTNPISSAAASAGPSSRTSCSSSCPSRPATKRIPMTAGPGG